MSVADHPAADSATATAQVGPRSLLAQARGGALALWGAFTGLAPHVLHHVGPLAGAAVIGGLGGTLLFAVLGVLVSVPFLLRLRRRFGTWKAPAIALAVFAAMFAVSASVGAALFGADAGDARPGVQLPAGHEQHH